MALDQVAASATSGGTVSGAAGAVASGLSFRSFLSDINPLQYVPVVGAVYRAATGDEGNPTLRFVASLGTSFALGGPLGVGITVAEKITGIDPERIARSLLSRLLHHGSASTAATTAATDATATAAGSAPTSASMNAGATGSDAASRPWSASELSAYAASAGGLSGATAGGAVTADTLNAMELQRVSTLYA